jgi:hypothetical protein
MAGDNFWTDVGKRIGIGLLLGVGIMMGITAVLLPASYMMNKLIYHPPSMRFMAGIIAGLLSIFSFLILIVLRIIGVTPQLYYFGLFPALDVPGQGSYTGWLKILFTIFSYIFHPFITFYSGSGEDKEGYKTAVENLLVKDKPTEEFAGQQFAKGAVSEAFFEKAREAGTYSDVRTWSDAMYDLTETGKKIFNRDAVESSKNFSSSYHKDERTPNIRAVGVGVEPTAANLAYRKEEEAYMEELREKEKLEEQQAKEAKHAE